MTEDLLIMTQARNESRPENDGTPSAGGNAPTSVLTEDVVLFLYFDQTPDTSRRIAPEIGNAFLATAALLPGFQALPAGDRHSISLLFSDPAVIGKTITFFSSMASPGRASMAGVLSIVEEVGHTCQGKVFEFPCEQGTHAVRCLFAIGGTKIAVGQAIRNELQRQRQQEDGEVQDGPRPIQ
jgi:hypothetical protein